MIKNELKKTKNSTLILPTQKKKIFCAATALALTMGMSSANAAVYTFNWTGLLTVTDSVGAAFKNESNPYYSDPTWGYGLRTQIQGSLLYDTVSGTGSIAIDPFDFANRGQMSTYGGDFRAIAGAPYMIGSTSTAWNGSNLHIATVWDATGFLNSLTIMNNQGILPNTPISSPGTPSSSVVISGGDTIINGTTFANSSVLPATDNLSYNAGPGNPTPIPIGPTPIAMTSFNVVGDTGYGTTLNQLSLGVDDGIGGSPQANGPFNAYNFNIDIGNTGSMYLVSVTPSTVPVPAALWLFGSGLLGLMGMSRLNKRRNA